ncbi:hypothetical protein FNV43_RR17962 [Rhamnella rubrinervis]|uniref:RRM domain-containing protein n=1 Tax=Rhamnella rubrinervis TaxID=2594499 RepID=A0A8K0E5B6_9ROSA|nr:hypothetical protein FNV43_RR17962 [Rhamnella rubrinervis]
MGDRFWDRVLKQFGGGSRSIYTLQSTMDNSNSLNFVSQEEFKQFHGIDRELYTLLVINLQRDPTECMQIIALFLWLERTGFPKIVKKMTTLPYILISELAEEAVTCLNCIHSRSSKTSSSSSSTSDQNMDIPLIQCLMEKEISLQFFYENRAHACQEVARIVKDVCVRALADIMQQAIERKANTCQNLAADHQTQVYIMVPAEDRTMFVTFSKGYPVYEWEVREFINRAYGDCIESVIMQEVQPNEQSLFARIVFHSASTIEMILDGMSKAKFTINGKHVWVRKYVPKHTRALLSPPRR